MISLQEGAPARYDIPSAIASILIGTLRSFPDRCGLPDNVRVVEALQEVDLQTAGLALLLGDILDFDDLHAHRHMTSRMIREASGCSDQGAPPQICDA